MSVAEAAEIEDAIAEAAVELSDPEAAENDGVVLEEDESPDA
jgi:hypothetical protein